ncbi:hypothetical protein DPX39_090040200 [Trypanosoma brucei equiperdum]|uniref:Uncharacterized protein n=1 Tax=Trypanosoma brucei equiperdum TaxID=630700 RepID=A0A3L6L1X6_9TRYP|nr:hypothetical protein DPX39_090040200 [Trypanosoma brucei equiperdum]
MSAFESFLLAAAKRAPFLVGDAVTSSTEQERAGSAQKAEGTISQQQEEENIAILQRLLVDGPLQLLGLEHALYHILIPAFTASMSAAREVWRAKVALQEVEHNSATNNDAEVPVAAGCCCTRCLCERRCFYRASKSQPRDFKEGFGGCAGVAERAAEKPRCRSTEGSFYASGCQTVSSDASPSRGVPSCVVKLFTGG